MCALCKIKSTITKNVILIKGYSKSDDELVLTKKMFSSYSDFFKSIAGGSYEDYEIITLNEPSVDELKILMDEKKLDFVILVFIGHGAIQEGKQLFQLNLKEIIQAGQLELDVDKQLIIFESCRNNRYSIPTIDLSDKMPNYKKGGVIRIPIKKTIAKKRYEQIVLDCDKGVVVCFACSVDQEAINFYFSKALLEISNKWHLDLRNYNQFLGIKDLMKKTSNQVSDLALRDMGEIQTPNILGDNDFPFVICKY